LSSAAGVNGSAVRREGGDRPAPRQARAYVRLGAFCRLDRRHSTGVFPWQARHCRLERGGGRWRGARPGGEWLSLSLDGSRRALHRERHDSFDIYLPPWLARHNKVIFGTLYFAGIAFALAHWALAAD
jgi:hypothetical protein